MTYTVSGGMLNPTHSLTHSTIYTKQYNLVPRRGQWCSVAVKITIVLVLHWPCIMDSVVYPPTGSTVLTSRWALLLCSWGIWPVFYCSISSSGSCCPYCCSGNRVCLGGSGYKHSWD